MLAAMPNEKLHSFANFLLYYFILNRTISLASTRDIQIVYIFAESGELNCCCCCLNRFCFRNARQATDLTDQSRLLCCPIDKSVVCLGGRSVFGDCRCVRSFNRFSELVLLLIAQFLSNCSQHLATAPHHSSVYVQVGEAIARAI